MEKYRQQFKKRLINIIYSLKPVSIKKWRSSSIVLFFGIFCFFSLMFSTFFSQYQIERTFIEQDNKVKETIYKYDVIVNDDITWSTLKNEMKETHKNIRKKTFLENISLAGITAFFTILLVIFLDIDLEKKKKR